MSCADYRAADCHPGEIPGCAGALLEEAATAIPDAAAGEVAEAMLALG